MSRNLSFRSKGTDHRRHPNKPGRTIARLVGRWEHERNDAARRNDARVSLAARVAAAEATRQRKAAAAPVEPVEANK